MFYLNENQGVLLNYSTMMFFVLSIPLRGVLLGTAEAQSTTTHGPFILPVLSTTSL
jgi:hypothetical protein